MDIVKVDENGVAEFDLTGHFPLDSALVWFTNKQLLDELIRREETGEHVPRRK